MVRRTPPVKFQGLIRSFGLTGPHIYFSAHLENTAPKNAKTNKKRLAFFFKKMLIF
jgi:hypothetical protein